ncbi:uncharacterized protein LOC112268512 [Brachypodium distachyon]|uniref:uncharacterized protein LOC112268512 n=1 Tax=Brachypodium distachyon TaxID=15368 RepID=UPI00071D35FD|nr:uncharacterized protein LOC112268512 [Brachypodium distachyon]|eukprot:XP_024313681.1 uncharacterized protein LOC112268512 [Brachypodium distachyon]
MASQPPPSSPASPTTIASLRADLLREVFLRLPDLPTLVCAASTCRAFRAAVRSSPSFRRSFRALHPPPLLAFVLEPFMEVIPAFSSAWRRSDPDLVAAFGATDFFDTDHLSYQFQGPGWQICSRLCNCDGYVCLVNGSNELRAVEGVGYNLLTQSLYLFLRIDHIDTHLEFHMLPSKDDSRGPSYRVICAGPLMDTGERRGLLIRHHGVAIFPKDYAAAA